MLNRIRKAVSGKRNRFRESSWDLDLCYVTNRVIAMGLPAEGITGLYRNNIKDIAAFLNERHPNHYLIWNLSELYYDESKFNDQVLDASYPNHHAPPMRVMLQIMQAIEGWLRADDRNVAVIHCLAGKGRTGTIIAAYLLFVGMFSKAKDALDFFAIKRSAAKPAKGGVTVGSQIRYCYYLERLLYGKIVPDNAFRPITFDRIIIQNFHSANAIEEANLFSVANFTGGKGMSLVPPRIRIFVLTAEMENNSRHVIRRHPVYDSLRTPNSVSILDRVRGTVSYAIDRQIYGDILIRLDQNDGSSGGRIQFHTALLEDYVLRVNGRSEIDYGAKYKLLKRSPNVIVDVYCKPIEKRSSIRTSGRSTPRKGSNSTPKSPKTSPIAENSAIDSPSDTTNSPASISKPEAIVEDVEALSLSDEAVTSLGGDKAVDSAEERGEGEGEETGEEEDDEEEEEDGEFDDEKHEGSDFQVYDAETAKCIDTDQVMFQRIREIAQTPEEIEAAASCPLAESRFPRASVVRIFEEEREKRNKK